MSQKSKTAIIACGSFNPLTIMHLRMFELAKDFLVKNQSCHVIEGIISPVSDKYTSNKPKYLAPAKHRCEMIRRALKPINGRQHWVRLDDWECSQPQWMRTIDVLRYHRARINDTAQHDSDGKINLMMLCGADLFESFNVPDLWHDRHIEEIARDFGIIVISRKGNDPWRTLKDSSKSAILSKFEKNIFIVQEKVENGISSSLVREAISKNESIRYLVDDSVLEYIHKNALYLTSS